MRKLYILPLIAASICFAEPQTSVTIDGRHYKDILGVSLRQDGQLSIITGQLNLSFQVNKVPSEFLNSWNITREQIERNTASAQKFHSQEALRQAETQKRIQIEKQSKDIIFTPNQQGLITLEHEGFSSLKLKEEARLKNLNISGEAAKLALASIPQGGLLVIKIERSTIGSANTKWFTTIIFDADGKEVQRRTGPNDVANVPSGNRLWWNLYTMSLEACKRPITVRVVDAISNNAYEFKGN